MLPLTTGVLLVEYAELQMPSQYCDTWSPPEGRSRSSAAATLAMFAGDALGSSPLVVVIFAFTAVPYGAHVVD